MKQTLKRIVSFMLVLTCVITMFPVSTFADSFVTNSETTAGGGKKYNEKVKSVAACGASADFTFYERSVIFFIAKQRISSDKQKNFLYNSKQKEEI